MLRSAKSSVCIIGNRFKTKGARSINSWQEDLLFHMHSYHVFEECGNSIETLITFAQYLQCIYLKLLNLWNLLLLFTQRIISPSVPVILNK